MYARKYNRGSQGPGGNVWKAAGKRWGRFNFYVYTQPLIHSPHFINVPSLTFPPDFPLFRHVRPLGAFNCLQSELGRPWGLKVKFWFSSFFVQIKSNGSSYLLVVPHWKLKRSVSAPKCQFSPAGQSLLQPFLEPFENNLDQKSSIKRLFQPTLGPISALGPNQP